MHDSHSIKHSFHPSIHRASSTSIFSNPDGFDSTDRMNHVEGEESSGVECQQAKSNSFSGVETTEVGDVNPPVMKVIQDVDGVSYTGDPMYYQIQENVASISPEDVLPSDVVNMANQSKASEMESIGRDISAEKSSQYGHKKEVHDSMISGVTGKESFEHEEIIGRVVRKNLDRTVSSEKQSKYKDALNSLKRTKEHTQEKEVNSIKSNDEKDLSELGKSTNEQAARVRQNLEEKLVFAQQQIDEEVSRVDDLIQDYIRDEDLRQTALSDLIKTLKMSIESKSTEVAAEEKIIIDMISVRSKLNAGAVANQLDSLIETKQKVSNIESSLIVDLEDCVGNLRSILEGSVERKYILEKTLARVIKSEEGTVYEWVDIENLEKVLDDAVSDISVAEKKVASLKKRIEIALIDKTEILGNVVYIPEKITKSEGLRQNGSPATQKIDVPKSTLEDRNDAEVMSVLGESLTEGLLQGSRAAAFAVRAVFDTATSEEVSEAASSVVDSSRALFKEISETTKQKDKKIGEKITELAESSLLKGGTELPKEASEAIRKSWGSSNSAKEAASALKAAGKMFVSAFDAAVTLAVRRFHDLDNTRFRLNTGSPRAKNSKSDV
eukprot:CAMPEP_0116066898 /NCGR_PEP_ID=MMETSP0322-20121206/10674_1 /TAXON_ID=163516 /ORGANISM="Leptocylindrus danicus var. apora, Strain B651" /LENGTH=609 /DNA_ID=CAMNT_0003553575 /DNA_START=194 /DNA_END=2023 /DNA_ORIENTATION=+